MRASARPAPAVFAPGTEIWRSRDLIDWNEPVALEKAASAREVLALGRMGWE